MSMPASVTSCAIVDSSSPLARPAETSGTTVDDPRPEDVEVEPGVDLDQGQDEVGILPRHLQTGSAPPGGWPAAGRCGAVQW